MKPYYLSISVLAVCGIFWFSPVYSESKFTLSVSNDMPETPVTLPNHPGVEYDHLPIDNFDSIRAKFPSALLSIKSYGTPGQISTVSMDGGPSEQTGIAVDGMPIENGQNSTADTSILPLELAESADIFKNNLLPYGINAASGMVNFNLPGTYQDRNEVSLYGGDFYRFGGKAVFSRNLNNTGFLIAGAYSIASNNFNYTNNWGVSNEAVNMDYSKYSLLGKFRISDLDASLSYTSKNGGTGFRYSTTGREKDDVLLSDLTWKNNDAKIGLSYLNWHDYYTDPSYQTQSDYTNQTITVQAENAYNIGLFTLKPSLGNKVFLLSGSGLGSHSEDEINAALEGIFKLGPLLTALSLNQIYRTSGVYAPTGGFSASWELIDSLKLSASISSIYSFPSFNDLYWPADGFSKGNPNLKPENGFNWKTGILYTSMPFTASFFYNESRLQNLILWSPVNGIWTPDNIGRTLSQGVGLTGFYENYFGKIYLRANMSYSLNYIINNDPASSYFGKRIIYSPLYKTAFGVEMSYLKSWGAQIAFHQASERFTTEANNDWLPAYYVVDARIFWEFLYFSVENILNYQYEEIEGYPQMGRSLTAGIDLKF